MERLVDHPLADEPCVGRAAAAGLAVAAGARPVLVADRPWLAARAIARGLRRVLVDARPASPGEIAASGSGPDARPARAAAATAELEARAARAATEALGSDAATMRAALAGLGAFAIPGAFTTEPDPTALRETIRGAAAAARERIAATAAPSPLAAIAILVGAQLPSGPTLVLDGALRAAFAARVGDDAEPLRDWLAAIARVRGPAGALDDLVALTRAAGRGGEVMYAQLPAIAGEPAVFQPDPPGQARLALLAIAPTRAPASPLLDEVVALAIDEWVEAVPAREATAGVAFHVERPDAQPPQAILIAVPPDPAAPWTREVIADILAETLDLAAIRVAPPEALGAAAHYLPATMFAFNAAGDTVSTDFTPLAEP
jgi:hypothetical protein